MFHIYISPIRLQTIWQCDTQSIDVVTSPRHRVVGWRSGARRLARPSAEPHALSASHRRIIGPDRRRPCLPSAGRAIGRAACFVGTCSSVGARVREERVRDSTFRPRSCPRPVHTSLNATVKCRHCFTRHSSERIKPFVAAASLYKTATEELQY